MVLVVLLLLVTPTVAGAAPRAAHSAATALDGQELSDFSVDPASGAFAVFVPTFTTPKLPLLGQQSARDVYACDFAGAGCHAFRHEGATGPNGARQFADATSFLLPTGVTARYAVGGPSSYVSMWSNLQSKPMWTREVLEGNVVAVAVEPNEGAYVVAASASSTPGSSGNRVSVFDGLTGRFLWDYNVTDANGATSGVSPTSLDFSRQGGILAVGTTKGVLFLRVADGKPLTYTSTNPVNTGSVSEVILSTSGKAALVRTTNGIDYIPLNAGKPVLPQWNRGLPATPTAIALSGDGERFAAAAGSKVYFYRHLGNSFIAGDVGAAHDVGATVSDLAYDATGSLLVASAGNRVVGFASTSNAPIWDFDATAAIHGGLDGPLKGVAVSDDASRITVAGKTKVMPYRTSIEASLSPVGPATTTIGPRETRELSFQLFNSGSLPDEYTFVVTRPVNWGGTNPESVSLRPDGVHTVNLTVESPSGQRPGIEAVKVEVRSKARGEVIATSAINLTVPRVVALEVDVQPLRVELQAGEERAVPLTVHNHGNAEGLVNLTMLQDVTGGPTWSIRFNPAQLSIGPDSAATAEMIITAPADGARGERNLITVIAREGAVEARDNVSIFIDPDFNVDVRTGSATLELPPGESRTFTFNVTNRGNTDDVYNITANVTPLNQVGDWSVRVSEEQLKVPRGQTRLVTVTVRSAVAEPRPDATLVVKAVSVGSGETVQDSSNVALILKARDEEVKRGVPLPPLALVLAALGAVAWGRRIGRGGA